VAPSPLKVRSAAAWLVLVVACEQFHPVEAPPLLDREFHGMVRIAAAGRTFHQGSTDALARADERPVMTNSFTYDYWLDRTEVTLAAYRSAVGRLPAEYGQTVTQQDLPVAHVTWYDAALYCNARSRMNGLDTVYTYTRVERGEHGTALRLLGFEARLEVEGYRLPTEAEWEFAARGGDALYPWGDTADARAALYYAWFLDNAGRTPHAVGQLRPNLFGLYDMTGNVMEWVNDWKGPYADTAIADFIGPASPEGDERVVKGGSFMHGLRELRASNRSDIYETVSSSQTPYLGFRCVLGKVPGPRPFVPQPDSLADSGAVRLLVHTTKAVTPTSRTRLVFVKRRGDVRRLCHVDFFDVVPTVVEFTDIGAVYLPTVSPDGEWVAFCTSGEGRADSSSVYVRRLDSTGSGLIRLEDSPAFVPRWWVDPSNADTFIVYTDAAMVNTASSWPATQTRRQLMRGGEPAGSPETVESQGSFHGGMSADGAYLATGFSRLLMKHRPSGEVRMLFTYPENGKDDKDYTSQVCNVSIAPSTHGPPEVLFVDFGSYGLISRLTGDRYRYHQYLFRVRYTGEVTGWYRYPPGYETWDHPEWSNVYECAVAGVQDRYGRHPAIFVVNLKDSAWIRVAQGEDLWHPYLWVQPRVPVEDTRFDLDSLGYYNEPPAHGYQAGLASKMAGFWQHHADIELMFLGSSRVRAGIASPELTRYKAYNMGSAGCGLLTVVRVASDYVLTQCPDIKLIGMSLSPGWMADSGGDRRWLEGMANTRGYVYDRNHAFWADSLPPMLERHVANAPNPLDDALPGDLGWYRYPTRGFPAALFAGSEPWGVQDSTYRSNRTMLEDFSSELADRGIHLLLIAFPQAPIYRNFSHNDTLYYGRYGPMLETAQAMFEHMRELEAANPYVHLYDAHRFGYHDYTPDEAYDADHLSEAGALKLTARLDSLVNEILGP
jgi:uncharacterized protein (TIGR02171 family)